MLFVIYGIDAPGKLQTRLDVRPENLDYLAAGEGDMLVAGPLLADDGVAMAGSLIIMDFPDRAAAERWLAASPLTKAGVYERVEIHPFTVKWPRPLAAQLAKKG
jgi:uncharacterized protein